MTHITLEYKKTKEVIQSLWSGQLPIYIYVTLCYVAIFAKEGTQEIQEGWRVGSRNKTKPTAHK